MAGICCDTPVAVVNIMLPLNAVFHDEDISMVFEEGCYSHSHNCCDYGYDIIIIIISWTESLSLMLCVARQACNSTRWVKLTEVMRPEHIQGIQPIICGPAVLCRASLRNDSYPSYGLLATGSHFIIIHISVCKGSWLEKTLESSLLTRGHGPSNEPFSKVIYCEYTPYFKFSPLYH